MNYHIMKQDKFLDSFIEDVYSINESQNNFFWFRGNKEDSTLIQTKHTIEYLGNDKEYLKNKIKLIHPNDSIFVHWYDNYVAELLYKLPNKIYVMLWGGEFYCDPYWYHQWVYEPLTLQLIKKNKNYPNLKFDKNLINYLKKIRNYILFKKDIKKDYLLKNKMIGRIDYFIFLDKDDNYNQDYKKIKELYPAFRAINISGFYDQNFDKALAIKSEKVINSYAITILLGNSAGETNNHLDAFEKLKNIKNCVIYCPLSYGSDLDYTSVVIKKGKEIFKERFVPMVNFMSRDEYVTFLNSIDVIYMYHNRQQAFGNICSGLTLGKPVFLKNENTIKGYLDALNIKTFDADKIDSLNLLEVINEARNLNLENYEILNNTISKEKRLKDLSKILESTK